MDDNKKNSTTKANHDMRNYFYDEDLTLKVEKPNQSIAEEANNALDKAFQEGKESNEIITHKQYTP